MLFACHSDPAVNAFDKQIIAQPALLFVARRNGLSVYALRSDERPSKDTPLSMAPFYNVYDDGRVCTGSMKVPGKLDPASTDQWSRAFFGSNFTHATGLKHWAHTGTYAELLRSVVERGAFDPSWLKKDRRTVGQVCSN
jgi:PRTRC genetic system protein B